jgi:hypothetical protein
VGIGRKEEPPNRGQVNYFMENGRSDSLITWGLPVPTTAFPRFLAKRKINVTLHNNPCIWGQTI